MKQAKLEIYTGGAGGGKGKLRWRFVAINGRIVADSGEAYTDIAGLLNGVTALQQAILSGDYRVVQTKH